MLLGQKRKSQLPDLLMTTPNTERNATIKRLFADGATDAEIAEALGSPEPSVAYWRAKLGLYRSPRRGPRGPYKPRTTTKGYRAYTIAAYGVAWDDPRMVKVVGPHAKNTARAWAKRYGRPWPPVAGD